MESTSQEPTQHETPPKRDPLLPEIKDHVVQLEAMLLYTLASVVVLFFVGQYAARLGALALLSPLALLAAVPAIVRVTNPRNEVRDRLNWAVGLGGFIGLVVGATADILSGGLTLGQGTLVGAGAGAALGGTLGPNIERWRNRSDFVERGEAFEFLFKHKHAGPHVANPSLIAKALDTKIPSFDINEDRRRWYLREHLWEYVSRGKDATFGSAGTAQHL
ncbi:MAG: hypothetical protein HY645_14860 [Acidobacteria bacterium]|nr:hypothetical protein [Acidobacteriota bacterium]